MFRRLFARFCPCHGCRCRRGEVMHKPVSAVAEPNTVWARLSEGPIVAMRPAQAKLMADFLNDSARTAEWLHEVRQGRRVDAI